MKMRTDEEDFGTAGATPAHFGALKHYDPPLGPGAFVAVVGPSGSGKDTLIYRARDWFSGRDGIVFPRRMVTRPPEDVNEDHISITEADYNRIVEDKDAALTWRAHGLGYIVPSDVDKAIADGAIVVANISRMAVSDVIRNYSRAVVVLVTAPREVLAERLKARGRETPEEIASRLDRADYTLPPAPRMLMIDNVASPAKSSAKLINLIERLHLEVETMPL